MKALVKKRGATCLLKEDAEDDISAFMSRLTWMNASTFLETLLNRILFSISNLCRQGSPLYFQKHLPFLLDVLVERRTNKRNRMTEKIGVLRDTVT